MADRSILVQGGDSAVLRDHHVIPEQYKSDAVLRLLQQNNRLLNNTAFDINAASNRIYLAADTSLAAAQANKTRANDWLDIRLGRHVPRHDRI